MWYRWGATSSGIEWGGTCIGIEWGGTCSGIDGEEHVVV